MGAKAGGKLVVYTTSGTTVRATFANYQVGLRLWRWASKLSCT